jgi:ferric-dicitrate binding protein FerR (iron transport regulator)
MSEERFDELLKEMRDEQPPPGQVEAAQERVWRRLAANRSPACEELQPALPDYALGRLTGPRRLLIEDHLGRCVDCRRLLATIKGDRKLVALPRARREARQGWKRWAVAAGVVLAALYVGRGSIDSALAPGGPRATVVTVSGSLQELSGVPLAAGAELAEGEVVRTAAGSRAILQLRDGSRLEMNERTELAVRAAWSGDTVRLERGDIIVQATEQGVGRLRVLTRDSIASVKGTVFAVSSGTAGSLVSVVEGSVEVSQPGFEKLLVAGQQAASSSALGQVGLQQAISWSQAAEDYYALLADLVSIEEHLAELARQSLRHEARLLPYLPANTFAYFAIPNLDGTIREALYQVEQRSWQNGTLAEWWSSGDGQDMRTMLERLQVVTPLLGEEMVLVVTGDGFDGQPLPLGLAEIRAGRHEQLREALEGLAGESGETIPYQIVGDLLLIASDHAELALLSVQLGAGASSPFAAEIARHYQQGVGWLAAFDVTAAGSGEDLQSETGSALGLANIRYLFLEQGSGSAGDFTEATLSFDGPRTGIASWLAAPGPSGSAEYVSPEAVMVSSGSTRDPREALDQLLSALGPGHDMSDDLQEFELETGVDLRNDIASSLGTDFVIAIERLTVPVPGWVAVFEVRNAGALDEAVRRLVAAANAESNDGQVSLVQEDVNGRLWSSLISTDADVPPFSWTYDRGYLVAGADRALALRAIGVRDSGSSLIRSAAFQQQFPPSGGLHSSGFFWLNTGGMVEELASMSQSPAAAALAASRDPVLVVITGEQDRIHWSSRTRLTSLLLNVALAQPIGELEGEPW